MNETEIKKQITDSEIDNQNYTLSMLRKFSADGTISIQRQNDIRTGLDEAFKEITAQYTERESSTISAKRAEILYSSVLYQCDIYLLSLKSNEKALDALQNLDISEILKEGQTLILQMFDECRLIFNHAYKMRLDVQMYEYNYIMKKSFDMFYKNYSARFDAKNIRTSIDYPLIDKPAYASSLQGVAFIKNYYTGIMLENEFCGHFEKESIIKILEGYGKIYKSDFRKLVFNISEVVFNNMLAVTMVRKDLFELEMTESDIEYMYQHYSDFSKEEFNDEAKKAFGLYYKLLKNPQLIQYFRKHISIFSDEIFNGIKNKNLSNILIYQENAGHQTNIK